MTTKISKSRLGDIRFPKHDKPFDNSVTTMKLTPEQMDHYLKTGELPQPKRGRGRPKKMEQTNTVTAEMLNDVALSNSESELRKLEQEVAELSKGNIELQNLLDDLQAKYNQLAIEHETAEQVRYDLTRTEGQRDQLKASLRETEDELVKESKKRWILETALKMYLP